MIIDLKRDQYFPSEQIIALIKEFEGFRSTAYYCSAKRLTIGYGSTLNVFPQMVVSEEQATKMMLDHIKLDIKRMKEIIKVGVYQHQMDAMISLVYNIGMRNFANSTLLRLLNRSLYEEAANQFLRWNKYTSNGILKESRGLSIRRMREREIFVLGYCTKL